MWGGIFSEEKSVSLWFLPWAQESTGFLAHLFPACASNNSLITRRHNWWQSNSFLTAGGTVAPASWFLCLHGVKRLHGSEEEEMWPCFFCALPEKQIVVGDQGNLLLSPFWAPSSKGIFISRRFKMRNLYKCTYHDFSALLSLILTYKFQTLWLTKL